MIKQLYYQYDSIACPNVLERRWKGRPYISSPQNTQNNNKSMCIMTHLWYLHMMHLQASTIPIENNRGGLLSYVKIHLFQCIMQSTNRQSSESSCLLSLSQGWRFQMAFIFSLFNVYYLMLFKCLSIICILNKQKQPFFIGEWGRKSSYYT